MTERKRNLLTGIASAAGLLALAALLLLFGELDGLLGQRYALMLNTNHASGLRRGSSVELNGVPIGVIDDVAIQRGAGYPVRITALIDEAVRIPRGSRPYAATSLLGASAMLELVAPQETDDASWMPRDGTAEIDGPLKIRMLEQITTELDERMVPILESLESFRGLAGTYETVGRNLNELLEPGAEGEPGVREIVAKVYAVLEEAERAMALAGDWLGDEQLRADARSAVAKASTLIDDASATLESVNRMAGTVERDADRLTTRLVKVSDQVSQTLEEVRRVTRLATEGDGSIARILNRPDLHDSLLDSARRLEQALREAELLIRKIKAEGLPVRF